MQSTSTVNSHEYVFYWIAYVSNNLIPYSKLIFTKIRFLRLIHSMQTLLMIHNHQVHMSQENKDCASVKRIFNDVKQSWISEPNIFVNTEGTTFHPVRSLFRSFTFVYLICLDSSFSFNLSFYQRRNSRTASASYYAFIPTMARPFGNFNYKHGCLRYHPYRWIFVRHLWLGKQSGVSISS